MPIRRRDVLDVLASTFRTDKACSSGIEQHIVARELLRRQERKSFNAFAPRRERIRELRRHGHDVAGRRADGGFDLTEGVRNPLDAEAEWRSDLHGIKNAAVLGARRLQMNAPDVPCNHDAHGVPAPWYGRPLRYRFRNSKQTLPRMQIIPVLDLKDRMVVRARMGQRDAYRPIETPLSPTSDLVDVARGLLSIYTFKRIYIADLDAIEGRGNNDPALARLGDAIPGVELWVDNGIADAGRARDWLGSRTGSLVLGSESQRDHRTIRAFAADPRVVLSLDFRGATFTGPPTLLAEPDAWPRDVIVMTLARVGSGAGPDLARLSEIQAKSAQRSIYAAGGVRDAADLAALKGLGVAGALVATSLHDGRLTGAEIAKLQDGGPG
jgi:HisA/HisF family protein